MVFDGSRDNYKRWEARFLGYLHILKLKETILHEPTDDCAALLAEDKKNNADCYAELIRLVDHRSRSLISQDAAKDGRKALKILKEHYAGKSQAHIINLYTLLTKLRMAEKETVTDYLLRAEDIRSRLKDAGESPSDGLVIAVILGGLPESFQPLSVHITQKEDNVTVTDLKRRLRLHEEAEQLKSSNSVSTANVNEGAETPFSCKKENGTDVTSCNCGMEGHEEHRHCLHQVWCGHCNSCTRQDGDRAHVFNTEHAKDERSHSNVKLGQIVMYTEASSHIVNDIEKFQSFDSSFQAHSVEVENGTEREGVVQQKGTAIVYLLDDAGKQHRAELQDALYISSYPHDVFSVARATTRGATITFKKGDSHMVTKDGSRFDIVESRSLFYLPTVVKNVDHCKVSHDMQTWHEILGHCDYEDLQMLHGVVKGMRIKGSAVKPTQVCEGCPQGKVLQTRDKEPDRKTDKPLELVYTELMGPMSTLSIEGYRYAQSFTDDYSGMVMVYFLKSKTDTVQNIKRFLTDIAPYGEVKRICSGGGAEFTSHDFQALLTKYGIRHDTVSPRQNDSAGRGLKTLYDMSTCSLQESKLPDELWNYAVQMAANVRNRWYCRHTRKTPYELFTGKRPNMSKLQRFGSICFTYKQEREKMDLRSEKSVFVGHDKYSPAFLVYYPDINRVEKHRLVKFVVNTTTKEEMPIPESYNEYGCQAVAPRVHENDLKDVNEANVSDKVCELETRATDTVSQRYPTRKKKRPAHLQDYELARPPWINFCSRAASDIPEIYQEATATKSAQWKDSMDGEIRSMEENDVEPHPTTSR